MHMSVPEKQPKEGERPSSRAGRQVKIDSHQLFGKERQLIIEHEGVDYFLRVTRHGKLILTK